MLPFNKEIFIDHLAFVFLVLQIAFSKGWKSLINIRAQNIGIIQYKRNGHPRTMDVCTMVYLSMYRLGFEGFYDRIIFAIFVLWFCFCACLPCFLPSCKICIFDSWNKSLEENKEKWCSFSATWKYKKMAIKCLTIFSKHLISQKSGFLRILNGCTPVTFPLKILYFFLTENLVNFFWKFSFF